MKDYVFKVVKKTNISDVFESADPTEIILKSGQKVGGVLTYKMGEWTKALPQSLGIFVFKHLEDAYNFLVPWGDKAILRCEYKGKLRQRCIAVSFPPVSGVGEKVWRDFLKSRVITIR